MQAVAWRPIEGCSFASTGCANCTALAGADSRLVRQATHRRAWIGQTRILAERLGEPTALPAPAAIYVCDHGDLFHDATPDPWIDRVFDVMEACPQHVFLLLTKRARRQRDYMLTRYAGGIAPTHLFAGISAERQGELDERGAMLLQTPAAVRFVTLYPLLGRIDLSAVLTQVKSVQAGEEPQRPADPAWFADIAAQCAAAGVAFARSDLLDAQSGGDSLALKQRAAR